ncbi:MAG: hypothetical protein SH857_13090 [Chitinophagales bacterium]|nr:hypothetical protein [Chitinophagales bacterium]
MIEKRKNAGTPSPLERGGVRQFTGVLKKLFPLFICLIVFSSCKYFKTKPGISDEQPVARVQDAYLYADDIEQVLKSAGNSKDSASFVKNYVDDWIKRKLMIEKALLYLPAEELDIDKQVNDYRESLILHAYEKALILQKLDTFVSDETALNYFEEFKQNFELNFDLVQLRYVKAPNNAPKLDSLITWLGSDNEADKIKLEDYCYRNDADFSLNDSMWFDVPTVLKTIPIAQNQFDALIGYKSKTTVNDSAYHYALRVNGFRRKGEIAPFDFVKDDILRITLNKRKMDLVRSTYDNIFHEAQRNNEFEIYK